MSHPRTGLLTAALLLGFVCGQAATNVSGPVSGPWPAGTYRVTGDLTVSATDTLTLAPGAVLKFLPGAGLACNGTLLAQGTADSLVVFTSRDDNSHGEILGDSDGTPAPGDWDGVYLYGFLGNLGSGHIQHALLRYGGGQSSWQANLYSYYSDSLVVEESLSEYSLLDGMRVANGKQEIRQVDFHANTRRGLQGQSGSILTVLDCDFTDNGSDAARLTGITPVHLGGNGGSGNGQDGLALSGSIDGSCLLESNSPGLPYVLAGELSGSATDSLRITAGTVIKAESTGAIVCNGVLRIEGIEGSGVVMTSVHDDSVDGDTNNNGNATTAAPGDWIGLYCYGYLGNLGILEASHLGVHYAGSGTRAAGLYLYYSDSALIESCEFSHSLVSGLRATNCAPSVIDCDLEDNLGNGILGTSSPLYIEECRFNGNALYGARLDGTPATQGGGNSGSGNGTNGIGLSGTAGGSLAWQANDPGFCYVLTGTLTVNAGDTLSLEAGTVVKGIAAGQLRVNGILLCPGVESAPIVFTSHHDDSAGGDTHGDGAGTPPQPGDWQGVYLYGYLGNQGSATLDWCELRYGGASLQANLLALYCDLLTATDCRFDHGSVDGVSSANGTAHFLRCGFQGNLSRGLYHEAGAAPSVHDCDFSDNGSYGALLTSSQNDYGNNSGTGNGINGMALQGIVEHNRLWQANAPEFPYILKADLTVSIEDTLILGPGLLFKAQSAAELQVNGVMLCQGTVTDPVDFTSIKDDAWGGDTNGDGAGSAPAPGDWEGLNFYGYLGNQGSGLMEYTRLRYGGAAPLNTMLRLEYCDDLRLTHVDLSSSAGTGVTVSQCDPMVDHSLIHENAGYGVQVSSGAPSFGSLDQTVGGYNRIWGNGGGYQFYNSSPYAVDAYFNDWDVYDSAAIDSLIRDDNEAAVGEVRFAPFILESGPPQFLSIVAYPDTQTLRLFWTPVLDAIAYKVYTSAEPWGPWVEDTGGVFDEASWLAPWAVNRRFFRVVAITADSE